MKLKVFIAKENINKQTVITQKICQTVENNNSKEICKDILGYYLDKCEYAEIIAILKSEVYND